MSDSENDDRIKCDDKETEDFFNALLKMGDMIEQQEKRDFERKNKEKEEEQKQRDSEAKTSEGRLNTIIELRNKIQDMNNQIRNLKYEIECHQRFIDNANDRYSYFVCSKHCICTQLVCKGCDNEKDIKPLIKKHFSRK